VSQRTAPSAPKQPKVSPWSRRAFGDVSPGPSPAPGPRCSRRAALQAPSSLRRRSTAVLAFGTEDRRRSDGLLLHNRTHITRVALAFSLNQRCKNSLAQPKLRVSRNRHPGRTWTKLPKSIFPNSSPSLVRVVPSSRWAELTTNSPKSIFPNRPKMGRTYDQLSEVHFPQQTLKSVTSRPSPDGIMHVFWPLNLLIMSSGFAKNSRRTLPNLVCSLE
jgi:hypothetical protein